MLDRVNMILVCVALLGIILLRIGILVLPWVGVVKSLRRHCLTLKFSVFSTLCMVRTKGLGL